MSKIEKKNSASPISGHHLQNEIRQLVGGLVYISETDAGFDVVSDGEVGDVSFEIVLDRFADDSTKDPKEEIGFAAFFDGLTEMREWYETSDIERAERFTSLKNVLIENLTDLHVFRVGRVQLDIYIVGRDRNGTLMGVKTKAVET
jgi:hypothetical protein